MTAAYKPSADLRAENMVVQMGPSHPAMHGTVRMMLELDGETVVKCDPQIGYLHRGFEKMAESGTYAQVFPYTDRLNYVSPLINATGYSMVCEKLGRVAVPDRAQWIRTIACEMSRITDHFTAVAAGALELGGFTAMLWAVEARDYFYNLIEELSGARITACYMRIGGVRHDLPDGFREHFDSVAKRAEELWADIHRILTKNRVFVDRLASTGVISAGDAIDYGWTGVCLRSTGVGYDVRKDHPYLKYGDVDFEVPVGSAGDNFDRYLQRMEEIRQSLSIIRQCFDRMAPGPVLSADWSVALPPKDLVYNTIEAMIAHFKLIMEGAKLPKGEAYAYVEGGNGELGFYLVSDGAGGPYRLHVRPPCFALMQALSRLVEGSMLADIIPTFDAINMIGGEIDR